MKNKVVKLIAMDDVQAPKEGTLGYVRSIDDAEQIHVSWENGSSLALIPGQDDFEYVSNQKALDIFEKRFKDAQTSGEVIQAIKQLEKWDSEVHYVVKRSEWFNSVKELLSSQMTCTLGDALFELSSFPNHYEEDSEEEIESMKKLTQKAFDKYGNIVVPSMEPAAWPIFPEDGNFVAEMHSRLEDVFEELRKLDHGSPIQKINRKIETRGDNSIFVIPRDEYIQELKETLRSFEGDESAAISIVLSDNEFDSSVKADYLDAIKDAEATDDKQLFVVIHRLGMTDLISSLWGEVVDDVKKAYACEANKILDSLEEAFKENGVKKDSLTLKNSSN